MLEEYQILILGSMLAGYILLRSLEGVITSIRRMKKDKAHKEYDKLVEKAEEIRDTFEKRFSEKEDDEADKFEKRFDTGTRRLKENE